MHREYFKSARQHLLTARGFKLCQDLPRMRMFLEWAQEDHNIARRILREEKF